MTNIARDMIIDIARTLLVVLVLLCTVVGGVTLFQVATGTGSSPAPVSTQKTGTFEAFAMPVPGFVGRINTQTGEVDVCVIHPNADQLPVVDCVVR